MITACIVNKDGSFSVTEIENRLDSYYPIIDCNTINIVSRRFAGRRLDVICDDEGLFTDHPVVTAIDTEYHPMLVGTIVIVRHDDEGETVSLTSEDVKAVRKSLRGVIESTGVRRIVQCDY